MRDLLSFLRASDGPTTVSKASRHIVGEMTDVPVGQVPGNVARRVRTWLHHGLLPTLAGRGIVDFDEALTVTLTDSVVGPSVEERPRRREDVDSASDCSNS